MGCVTFMSMKLLKRNPWRRCKEAIGIERAGRKVVDYRAGCTAFDLSFPRMSQTVQANLQRMTQNILQDNMPCNAFVVK